MNSFLRLSVILALGCFAASGVFAAGKEAPAKTKAAEPAPAAATPAPAPAPAAPAAESPKASGAGNPGILDSLWLKVRQTAVTDEEDQEGTRASSVAGIRGAKSQDDMLKPIWKGKNQLESLPADARRFEQAKASFQEAKYPAAIAALLDFQKSYPTSQLKPQAQILLALCQAKSNNPVEAVKALDDFLKAFPDSPLAEEAKQLKATLAPAPKP